MHATGMYQLCCPDGSLVRWSVDTSAWDALLLAGIILTNDGNAILREIDVAHPAAKVLLRTSMHGAVPSCCMPVNC